MSSQPIPPVTFPEGQFEKILEKHRKYVKNNLTLWEGPWDGIDHNLYNGMALSGTPMPWEASHDI
jgi:hypothetical protein